MNKENKYKVGDLVKSNNRPMRLYQIMGVIENYFSNGDPCYQCRGVACEEKKERNIFYWTNISKETLDNGFEIVKGKR